MPAPHGTAITIQLANANSLLLHDAVIAQAVKTHFYPFLDPVFGPMLEPIYKTRVTFLLNRLQVSLPPLEETNERE